jgi:predicted DNA-binding transcriptional regulator AlpA
MPSASSIEGSNLPPTRTSQDELIPMQRVARVLKLHAATVRAMYRRGDFPAPFNVGARKILFSRHALDIWFSERVGLPGARFPID